MPAVSRVTFGTGRSNDPVWNVFSSPAPGNHSYFPVPFRRSSWCTSCCVFTVVDVFFAQFSRYQPQATADFGKRGRRGSGLTAPSAPPQGTATDASSVSRRSAPSPLLLARPRCTPPVADGVCRLPTSDRYPPRRDSKPGPAFAPGAAVGISGRFPIARHAPCSGATEENGPASQSNLRSLPPLRIRSSDDPDPHRRMEDGSPSQAAIRVQRDRDLRRAVRLKPGRVRYGARRRCDPPFPTPVEHVVVILQENHSFDNVLGQLCIQDHRRM